VLALTAVDPGGARVRLSSTSSHSSAFGGSQGSAFGGSSSSQSSFGASGSQGSGFGGGGFGSTSQGQGDAYANEEDGEDAEDEDEADDEDEDQPSGAPLYFWYLLQEALWEVPVSFCFAIFLSFPLPFIYSRFIIYHFFRFESL
jgi:hypothetical protein